jgi:hypothetical protein
MTREEWTAELPSDAAAGPEHMHLFARRIQENNWEDCFEQSQRGDEPWIFYISDDFSRGCLESIDKVLDAFGPYRNYRAAGAGRGRLLITRCA